jgi:hypothetical protein
MRILTVLLPAALLFVACSGGSHTLTGTVWAVVCDNRYRTAGSPVTVRNETGAIVGSGVTVAGPQPDGQVSDCASRFSLKVDDAKFYSVAVGAFHGAPLRREDVAAKHWHIDWPVN